MSWDSTTQNQMNTTVNNARALVNTSLDLVLNQSERAALDLDGAQDQINRAKETIDTKINDIKSATARIDSIIDNLSNSTKNVQAQISEKLKANELVRTNRDEAKSFHEVRMAQVNELKTKNQGNYHSSWLGLWRPLTDDSRTGLFITSIVLGIVALLSIVFIMMDPIAKMLPASVSAFARPHGGGLYESFHKKK